MNSKVLFDEDGWARLQAEVPKMKLVTPSALVERLKINGSLARAACKLLAKVCIAQIYCFLLLFTNLFLFVFQEGKITPVEVHHKQLIYTRVTAV
jgi:small subunit ribosomal protein S25e